VTKWYESDNPDRVGFSIGLRILAIVAVIAVLGIGVWVFKVATSDTRGAGDATRTKNSGTNRIAAQERFEELYAGVKAADQKVGVMRQALTGAPTDVVAQTNYTGAVNYCIDLRAQYDAEARKYTAEDWRSIDLPQQIDQLDPATDCKEPKESK
jgi:hypothetical protein